MSRQSSLFKLITILCCISLAYLLFFYKISEARYNKMMKYYIARRITDNLNTFHDKVIAIRDYVHETIHPIQGYHNRLDTVGIEKLISGIGWCDQQSRVFMQLASSIGITTRLLFLRSDSGDSPHTVAEALSPRKRWVLVDTSFRLDLTNREGRLATQSDIKNDLGIVSNNGRVIARAKFEEIWTDKNFLSIYSNPPSYIITRKGVKFDFLKPIPVSWLKPIVNIIQDRYFKQMCIKDIYEFKMMKARGYQLLGYYERSDKLYKEIIENSKNQLLKCKAEFYYALLLKEQKKYENAYRYISEIIAKSKEDPYIEYLYGLRASILKKMGRFHEAEQDLLKIEYSLEAS